MLVDQSGGLRMEIGVLYLSHAMLVLAELIVCSTRGFACILAKWFWPTVMSLSFTYGSPEASCNKRADTYLERRSSSLMKEFWTLCIFVMTGEKCRSRFSYARPHDAVATVTVSRQRRISKFCIQNSGLQT